MLAGSLLLQAGPKKMASAKTALQITHLSLQDACVEAHRQLAAVTEHDSHALKLSASGHHLLGTKLESMV